jgi:hypothetical protein
MTQSSIHPWQTKADINGRLNISYFVTDNEKYCIYYSDIDEYGIMKYVSPVEIWTDKESPKQLFKSNQIKFEYQYSASCYYLDKSDILVLLSPCFRNPSLDLLYILLDFNKGRFATINSPNYILTEINQSNLRLDIHFRYRYDEHTKAKILEDNGKIINIDLIEWFELKNIDNLCTLVKQSSRQLGFFDSGG